ncbi:GTPase SAR1 family protein [Algoriphagus ornithinivorans]|uniref:GTPase SAR1 family protein n=1 Tax=Algoriphagus ornithinivorans TaxID=226506 RepID=A0A1I5JEF5_9BACT|nr:GTPase domain-containing protein [Algoriphagus ornithinivorans]SFO71060.1 GTPase SAR1 family protein [Algoriphagus ornithinivorans]
MLPLLLTVLLAGSTGFFLLKKEGFGFWGNEESKKSEGSPIKEIRLAILGPSSSGKTTLFHYLTEGKILKNPDPTSLTGEKIKEKIIEQDNKRIKLLSTEDIPGSESSIMAYCENLIIKSDFIFFIFNCYLFQIDEKYCLTTKAFIDFVFRHNNNKRVILIGSHVDKLHNQQDSENSRRKDTENIINILLPEFEIDKIREIELVNLTSSKEISNLKSMLFK